MSEAPRLIAYETSPRPLIEIVPASKTRDWMDNSRNRFAYRCLPLTIGNQAGWWLLNSHDFTAVWNGRNCLECVTISYPPSVGPWPATSHFGEGILTFQIPYLFRTSEDWVLIAKGPTNYPKPGVHPLEGIIETDWLSFTFTMNYMLTDPGRVIEFKKGEPFCQLIPIRRGDLESIEPVILPMKSDPGLQAEYESYRVARNQFNADLKVPGSEAHTQKWQKDYFRGRSATGMPAPQRSHQTNLKIREFSRRNNQEGNDVT